MKKVNVLWIILDLIFLVVFNVIFFILGGTGHKTSVWISYAFIHFAYLMVIITPILIREGKNASLFGFTLYSVSAAYFLFEFIIGTVFILVSLDNYKVLLSVQIAIAGLYGIILISNMIANEYTADAEEERQYQIEYVKTASIKVKGLLDRINDKEARKRVEKVYDAIYSSPVNSNANLMQMEQKILESIDELEGIVSTGSKESITSLANTLLSAVNERNMRLRNMN